MMVSGVACAGCAVSSASGRTSASGLRRLRRVDVQLSAYIGRPIARVALCAHETEKQFSTSIIILIGSTVPKPLGARIAQPAQPGGPRKLMEATL